ncbi:hypothetical protein BCR42DRAFT_405605 [Absidia repens]|uniref:Uncharacterized protein n=1 Tax=Absidia repens TaxID=90262 RepID=A0A1X2ITR1_9FUNG|nr:hypothetical protein BCR42DRAFT_405605 [Absidia repens]
MFPPCRILPATCELCGNWLPDHQASCPRNGVHPSQWSMDVTVLDRTEPSLDQQQQQDQDELDLDRHSDETILRLL